MEEQNNAKAKKYIQKWSMHMRTNIVLDDVLMAEAMRISQLKTKKAVIEKGLKLLIQVKKQENIRQLKGKLKWEGDLDKMRRD